MGARMANANRRVFLSVVFFVLLALAGGWFFAQLGHSTSPGASALPITPITVATLPSNNAADVYRQAIDLINQAVDTPGDAGVFDRMSERASGDIDPAGVDFIRKYAAVAELNRKASTMPSSDWGSPAMDARLQEMNGIRRVFRFTQLDARLAVQSNDLDRFVDDVLADIAMARHRKGMITDRLVSTGIEVSEISLLAVYLPKLTSQQLKSLPRRLDALPAPQTGVELLAAEYAFAKSQGSNIAMSVMINSMEPFYKTVGVALDTQPPDQFTKTVDAEAAKYSANMLVKTAAPSIRRAREPLAVLDAQRAMLRTAIEFLNSGDAAIAASKDPFGTGPFSYARTRNGFELSSQLMQKDVPVTLVVGQK